MHANYWSTGSSQISSHSQSRRLTRQSWRMLWEAETLHARHTILLKEIVTNVACSAARVFRTPTDVSRYETDRITPRDINTAIGSTRLDYPVLIGGSTTGSPTRTGSQDIICPRGSIRPHWSSDAKPLDTSINGIYSKHRDPTPTWIKLICCKFTDKSSANVNSRCRMNLARDVVLTESPNFTNQGLSSVHTPDELRSVFVPTTKIKRLVDGSNWIPSGHCIG